MADEPPVLRSLRAGGSSTGAEFHARGSARPRRRLEARTGLGADNRLFSGDRDPFAIHCGHADCRGLLESLA